MTISASMFQSATVRDVFKTAITSFKWANTTPDTFKVALYPDTITPDPNVDPATYNVSPYTGEITGTGWSAGGVALTTLTLTIVAGVGIKFDADDVSAAATTITNAKGCLIYNSTEATKYAFLFVNFGANYSTSNGTFGIQWDATNGIALIDLTPA